MVNRRVGSTQVSRLKELFYVRELTRSIDEMKNEKNIKRKQRSLIINQGYDGIRNENNRLS